MNLNDMRIADSDVERIAEEREIIDELLPLTGARVLELGCGKAEKTRLVAQKALSVLALEVDAIQLANNRANDNPGNIRFEHGGAENIPAADSSFDIVLMFKSLHHVPVELMNDALSEVRRVLKTGGLAYISEPVYAGDFNEILRLFHDERMVRESAFATVKQAVSTNQLPLVTQRFFLQPMHFEDFRAFENQVLMATHTDHKLSAELLDEVRLKFNKHMSPTGATFQMPIRIDLLSKSS